MQDAIKVFVVALISLCFAVNFWHNVPSDPEEDHTVVVQSVVVIEGKHTGHPHMIYKMENGKIDSTEISVATYATAKPGDRYTFRWRKSQVYPETSHEGTCILGFFWTLISFAAAVISACNIDYPNFWKRKED